MTAEGAHTRALTDFRRRKDEHFASGRGPIQDLSTFRGLSYYPPDPAWAVTALVEPGDGAEVTLGTNTGETRGMARYGTATFELPEGLGTHTLTLYAALGEEAPARVFVPFRDATSGPETYGAGRYLDAPLVHAPEDGGPLVHLDFNLAYHPYCAYGEGWTCPLPPRENWLDVPVRAGERLPEA